MSTEILHKWSFVPMYIESYPPLGLEQKAVLVLDNCPAHPNAENLVSDDVEIIAHYLPPDVTSLIQPMDQGILEALTHRYKLKILRRLLIEEANSESVVEFLKCVDMKVVADLIAESWDERSLLAVYSSQTEKIPSEEPSSCGGIGEETSSEGQDVGGH